MTNKEFDIIKLSSELECVVIEKPNGPYIVIPIELFSGVFEKYPIDFYRSVIKLIVFGGHGEKLGRVKVLEKGDDENTCTIQCFENQMESWTIMYKHLNLIPKVENIGNICFYGEGVQARCLLYGKSDGDIVCVFPKHILRYDNMGIEYKNPDTTNDCIIESHELSSPIPFKQSKGNGLVFCNIEKNQHHIIPKLDHFIRTNAILGNTAWFWDTSEEQEKLIECKVEDPKECGVKWKSAEFEFLRELGDEIDDVLLIRTKEMLGEHLIGTPVFVASGVIGLLAYYDEYVGLVFCPYKSK